MHRAILERVKDCFVRYFPQVFSKRGDKRGRVRLEMKKMIAFLKDESGQTSTEYILLVAVAAMIVFKFKKEAQGKLDTITNEVFGKAETWVDQIDTSM